ncbi:MAG: sulfatase [Casimicrobiaceae bacterium]
MSSHLQPGNTSGSGIGSPLQVLQLAMWFGLVAGACEVTLLGVRKYVLHRLIFVSVDAAWMVPLADVLIFAVVGLALVAARAVLPGRLAPPPVLVLCALAVFTILLMYHPLYPPAGAILALGIGMAVARFLHARMPAFHHFVRRSLPVLLAALLITAGTTQAMKSAGPGDRAAAGAASPRRPNVLLIVLDTVRASHLTVYGYGRATTPQLQRWLGDGARFEHALSTAPWTLPSHASMFTGRFTNELDVDWLAPLGAAHPTLAETFAHNGYATAGFVANTRYCSRETGLARGFAHYEDYPVTAAQVVMSSSLGSYLAWSRSVRRKLLRKSADDVNASLLAWLDGRDTDVPFFAFLNYMDAHAPYQPPAPFDRQFSSPDAEKLVANLREDDAGIPLPPEVRQAAIDKYDESLAYLDDRLGALFASLAARQLWDDTIVVVTSDHGEEFGEHGVYYHGNSLYRGALEVPLLLRFPARVPVGARIETPVSLRDLPATLLDLAGLPAALPGSSLSRNWGGISTRAGDGDKPLLMELTHALTLPANTPVSKGSMASVLLGDLRLIRNGDGREELYDFRRDPMERVNLADQPAHQVGLARLREALAALAGAKSRRAP